jgi:hypothetical protein
VVSTDGLLDKEAKILLRKLSAMLAENWEKPYSEVGGCVNARMSVAIVRATHFCICGSRTHSEGQNVQPPPAVGGQSRSRPFLTLDLQCPDPVPYTASLQQLAHDAHRQGSKSEPRELLPHVAPCDLSKCYYRLN